MTKTKTKIKIETIVQPMYKVFISSQARKGWFFCLANSETEAFEQAKQKYPTYTIGEQIECLDNWSICWYYN